MSPQTAVCGAPRSERSGARRWCGNFILAALIAGVSGCTLYHPKPLPSKPNLVSVEALRTPAAHFGLPGLTPAPLDPHTGFTAVNLMELAVAGDPQLRATRARAGVADAQLFAAGLLPDPQISAGWSQSPVRTGYSIGLMEDVRALLTMQAAEQAAGAHVRQVNLEILWQEWQVAERARMLFVRAQESRHLRAVLAPKRRLLAALLARDDRELASGDMTAAAVAAELAEWNAAQSQWQALALEANRTWHAIDGLLGLRPGARLRLCGTAASPVLSRRRFLAALTSLPRRRPDLLALRAGYESAEEELRAQILRQFPLIGAGVQKARSAEEGIQTTGFNVTLTLPLFNRNRGAIAIARASREYLYQVYQSRLDAAVNQADQLYDAGRIMRRQLHAANAHLVRLERAGKAARASFERGELDLASYTAVAGNVASARMRVISLRASVAQATSALGMLLALPL